MELEEIQTYPAKRKVYYTLVISLFGISIAIALFVDGLLNDKIIYLVLSTLMFLISLMPLVGALRRIIHKGPTLIINSEGISGGAFHKNIPLTRWELIEEFQIFKRRRTQMIMIMLKDPESYIEGFDKPLYKKLLQTSYKNYGTPIGISTYYYEKEVEEIAKMIVERAAEYGYEFNDVF